MNAELIKLWNGYLERLGDGLLGTPLQDLTLLHVIIFIAIGIVIFSLMD